MTGSWLTASSAPLPFGSACRYSPVVAFLTVVGIPFGLALLFVALPLLWFLGYVVAGTRLGGRCSIWGARQAPRTIRTLRRRWASSCCRSSC